MDDEGPCRVGSAGRRERSITWVQPRPRGALAAPERPRPWLCPIALSYLVSGRSPLAVGALQEPRLFGKFI